LPSLHKKCQAIYLWMCLKCPFLILSHLRWYYL
jgi:hypothetical protein